MGAYYNEIEPYAAQWLRNLIKAGHIAEGDVDERSIVEVEASDLRKYDQCHFFAGIGAWSYALRSAGWADDRKVWTGSCPCQPFSTAGTKRGFADERHLWPVWAKLIAQCRPDVLFGEQVANRAALEWLDVVRGDLERNGYAVGAIDLCAASVGAPHIRQRLYWVADARHGRRQEREPILAESVRSPRGEGPTQANGIARQGSSSFWIPTEWLECDDGKKRPTEPGLCPLAYGPANRMGRIRAYGNALVAPVAEAFVRAYMDVATGCG